MAVIEYSFEIVDTLDLTGLSSVSGAELLMDPTTFLDAGLVVAGEGATGSSSLILDMDGGFVTQAGGLTGTGPATAASLAGFVTAVDAGSDIAFEVRSNAGELIVPTTLVGEEANVSDVDVEMLNDGFALVYQMRFSDTDNDIRVSIRDADGGEVKTFSVDATGANDQAPTIAQTSGGGFVVAWHRVVGNDTQMWYALYDADGAVEKGPTLLDAAGTINRNACAISLDNGNFAIAYEDNGWAPSGNDIDITYSRFDQNGVELETADVSKNGVDDTGPSLTRLRNGMIVVGSATEGAGSSDASWTLINGFDGAVLASQTLETVADESGMVVTTAGMSRFAALFNDVAAGSASGRMVQPVRTTTGSDDDESLFGDWLVDVVHGGGGADYIGGGGGADRLFGQGGDDRFILSGELAAGTIVHGGAGTDTVAAGTGVGDFRRAQLVSIEKLSIEGYQMVAIDTPATAIIAAAQVGDQLSDNLVVKAVSMAAETLKVVLGSASSVDLSGFTFEGFDGQKDGVVIIGGNQANTILGSAIADSISGGGGKDLLRGGGGIDLVRGGAGDDIFIVDAAGEAREAADQGRDTVRAAIDYTLGANLERLQLLGGGDLDGKGNALGNELYGNGGANLLSGGLGRDLLNGRGGVDDLRGGAGNDVYLVNAAGEAREKAGEGVDTVRSSVSYTLGANLERLQLLGGVDTDAKGNAMANRLTGNGGDNVLNGAGGNDRMAGGGGEDGFLFNSALGAGNVDMILDFDTADDSIRLDDAIFAGLTNAGRAAAFHVGKTAADASDRIIYNPETGALFFDADGKGGAAQIRFATLDAGLELTAADIIIV
ncbi:MAG TPA: calcium-binding protein [Allosphingosinicella sp.]